VHTLTQYRVYEQVASEDVNAPSAVRYRGTTTDVADLSAKEQIALAKEVFPKVAHPIIEQRRYIS
jgi:hypothetical protein